MLECSRCSVEMKMPITFSQCPRPKGLNTLEPPNLIYTVHWLRDSHKSVDCRGSPWQSSSSELDVDSNFLSSFASYPSDFLVPHTPVFIFMLLKYALCNDVPTGNVWWCPGNVWRYSDTTDAPVVSLTGDIFTSSHLEQISEGQGGYVSPVFFLSRRPPACWRWCSLLI